MVVPELLRDGDDRLDVYRIDGEPGRERLRPIRLRDQR